MRVVLPSVAAGELLRIPMSREDYLALGETKCDECGPGHARSAVNDGRVAPAET